MVDITGTAVTPSGAALTAGTLRFELNPAAVTPDAPNTIFPAYVTTQIGALGAISFALEDGEYIGTYVPEGAGVSVTFNFYVPDEESATFNECLAPPEA